MAIQDEPCLYCGLREMALCARGFPGCARADDMMIALMEYEPQVKETLSRKTARLAKRAMSHYLLLIFGLPVVIGFLFWCLVYLIRLW